MRVLHIFTNPHITNGATVFEYRVSGFLKEKNIYFDYLVTEDATENEKKRYKQMGSKLYKLPIDNNHGLIIRELKVNREYYRFFKKHHYDIVYADTENSLRSIHLLMAKLAGVPVRVVHSHNTSLQTQSKASQAISRMLRGLFSLSATDFFACSDLAAEWLFPKSIYRKKRYKILKNGVDLKQFSFDENIRNTYRAELGLESSFVIGNVGRFMPQKNHDFIISVFSEALKIIPNAKLLLIGDGPDKQNIEKKAKKLGVYDKIVFISNVPDVSGYLQAMDVFFMPSLFEGLPITGIEAQASGLPCLFSDTITKELAITDLADYMSLNESPEKWALKLGSYKNKERKNTTAELKKNGYSITGTVKWLERFYFSKGRSK